MGYKDKTVTIIDNGLFVEFAVLLAKTFGTVNYWTPWENAYPKANELMVGAGLPGVTRLTEPFSTIDETDLYIFPDVYHGSMQQHLVSLGKRVWGCRSGEQLELDRDGTKKLLGKLGLPVGPYKVVHGLDNLRSHLQDNNNQWVKVSLIRGSCETFQAKNYKLIEPRLDELEHSLGALKNVIDFIVEADLNPATEIGYDGYCIDGSFPSNALFGVEIKDKGFVMKATTYDQLPKGISVVNDKLSPVLKAMNFRGFWSTEVRIMDEDETPYFTDPCPRCGSPPSELYQLMISNWPDIFWNGAGGDLVEPEFKAQWGAELLILSEWADQHWQAIEFPPSLRPQVKLRNCCMIDGRYYCAPQFSGAPEIGAVVALGSTPEEAISNCKSAADKVQGHYIDTHQDSLDEALEELQKIEGKLKS